MIIKDKDGGTITIDFQYIDNSDGRKVTFAELTLSGVSQPFRGAAWCHKSDPFVKAKGRKLALARAMREDAMLTREERRFIWNELWAMGVGK